MAAERAQWKSRFGFVLAAAGSAVGLGNIWKFPYITGENGGGLFVLIYLVCIALVGVPIMMAEILIGRAAQKQPVVAFHELQGRKTNWSAIGWLGVLAGFVILSYYIVVAGWAMDFTLKSVVNFTAPIHEEATTEATVYRATADLDEMRSKLSARRAAKASKDEVTAIRQQATKSAWDGHARFEKAVAEAENKEDARRRLLTDSTLRAQVEEIEKLNLEIAKVQDEAQKEADEHYASVSKVDIMDEAETVRRREIIFDKVKSVFLSMATDGWTSLLWSAIFMFITISIVAGGVAAGIERTCRVLMPTLLVLIMVMVVYGAFKPGFAEAVSFVFKPDHTKLKPSGVLEALGHAFFTLSLGMGAMITYGSYQKSKRGLLPESLAIALLDTGIALLACMMIFPIIFSYGQEPGAGPGLVFMSMPLAFAEIGLGGMLLAIVFFGLLVFAALTSAISLLEVVASYFIDQFGWSRRKAAWLVGMGIFVFAIPSAFSLDPENAMVGWKSSFNMNFFDVMDYLASNWMLPIGGLFISFYAGWIMPRRLREAEMEDIPPAVVWGWLALVRFVAPVLVILVLAQKVGLLDADELIHGLGWFR